MYAEKSREFRLTSRLEFESRAALQEFYIGDLSAYSLGAKRNSTFRTGSFRLILSASFPSTCRQAFEESISISIARWMAKIRPCVAIEASLIDYRIVNFQFFVQLSSTIIQFSDEFNSRFRLDLRVHRGSFRNRDFNSGGTGVRTKCRGKVFSKRAKNIGVKRVLKTDLAKQVA